MSKHWKEPLDTSRHVDFMRNTTIGGQPREPARDPLIEAWSYFVRVNGFTFEFASLEQIRACIAYCTKKVRRPGVTLEHYWSASQNLG